MKYILRNLYSVFRRFRVAMILNVMGLSVAFSVFLVIMMQVDYDFSFDGFHSGSDRIYRMEFSRGGEFAPTISYFVAEGFIQSSPFIEAGTITQNLCNPDEIILWTESSDGRSYFKEEGLSVSSSFTDVFDFCMVEGSAKALEKPGQILIPQSLSQKLFGKVPAMGRLLTTKNASFMVGGVYKDFPQNSTVRNFIYYLLPDEMHYSWSNWNYNVYVRLNAEGCADSLISEFKRTFDAQPNYGVSRLQDAGLDFRLTPLADVHFIKGTVYDTVPKSSREILSVLVGVALLIVIIACINFTNFSMALVPARIKSINIHKILGGGQSVLRISLVGEAIGIAFISFCIALGLVFLISHTFVADFVDVDLTPWKHARLVTVAGLIAFITGIFAGVYPAYYMTSFQPALVLNGNFGFTPGNGVLRNILVGVQFLTSFVLIIGALFMYLQNYYIQNAPLSYDKELLIIAELSDPIKEKRQIFTDDVKSYQGIRGVGYANHILSSRELYDASSCKLYDREIWFQILTVDPSFLSLMGIEIIEGRNFIEEDESNGRGAYIFNDVARKWFNLQPRDIIAMDPIEVAPIVGFIPDVKFMTFRQETTAMAFYVEGSVVRDLLKNSGFVYKPWEKYAYIKVKAGTDIKVAKNHVESSLKKIDPEYVSEIRFFDDVLNSTYEKERRLGGLITLFSLIAILISAMGVFGMVMFDSEFRRREIGIRKVFGSSVSEILLLFNKMYIRILCVGFTIAVPLSWYGVERWLENFAYKTPMYWWVYLLVFIVVLAVTVCIVTYQNWQAARLGPVDAVKSE